MRQIFPEADQIRISQPLDEMFCLVGNDKANSTWKKKLVYEDDELVDVEYLEETIVASGHTFGELVASALEYRHVENMTSLEHFEYITGQSVDDDFKQLLEEARQSFPSGDAASAGD